MSTGATLSPRRAQHRITQLLLALVGGLAIVFTSLLAFPQAGYSAENDKVKVTDVTLSFPEGEDDGQVTIGDTLVVSGNWDATEANPQPGDTFFIGVPAELGFDQAVPFELTGEAQDGTSQVWAQCLTDPTTNVATCTFTDAVATYPNQVQGTFEFEVEAIEVTTEDELTFNLNGTEGLIEIPGEGGIDDGIELPSDWSKAGSLNNNKWSMTWTIDIPGAKLAGNDVVTIRDKLSNNHVLCAAPNLKVETVRGDAKVDVTEIAELNTTPTNDDYAFEIDLTAPETGFDPNVTYRITYETCTPDGLIDPKDTEYTNEAFVDIFGDQGSGVIGVDQDWAFTVPLTKSGSIQRGGKRNGEIVWTVTVSGDQLVGKDSFTLSETLTGPHEVRAETISGITIREQYGPNPGSGATINIKPELEVTEVTPFVADEFEVEFSIADDSDFAFKPLDHLYVITYTTYSTTDGLPAAGTEFGNTAAVNGETASNTPKVPNRSEGKGGNLNTSAVEIDGVDYLPQTTMNWSITVPGEKLKDLTSPLEVIDTISGTHQVCEAGPEEGGLKKQLNLRVRAQDQISNGGLSTVELTDSVTASEQVDAETGDDQIKLVIPQPTLPLPGGGTATGFSHEYQYIITYTTCTTSGGMDAPGTNYANSALVNGKTYTRSFEQSNRGSGTGTGVAMGSFNLVKGLADVPGAEFVPEDATFTVHVKEISPDTPPFTVEYDLEVPLNGDPVKGLNSRGNGWTIELSEPTFPSIPGVSFGTPKFTQGDSVAISEDGSVATVSVTPRSNIDVTLTNSTELGSLNVTKVLEGPAKDLVTGNPDYNLVATIDVSALGAGFPAQPDRTFTLKDGATHTLNNLPIGATVTISETKPTDDDTFTWAEPVISPTSIVVTTDHVSQPATITVTNSVDRTYGTFSLSKNVTGAESDNPAVPEFVTVTATWNEEGTPGSKTLQVPTDGSAIAFGEDLLVGTVVTLTETALTDGSGIAWGAPVWAGTGVVVDGNSAKVTITRDAEAAVTLENHAATSTAGLSFIKGIAGEAGDEVSPETTFPITVTWVDGEGETQTRNLEINAVEPTVLDDEILAGTVVTVTEGERPAFDTVIWDSITISGNGVTDAGNGSATIVVSDQQGDVALVTIVNEATWAPGTFSITKNVTGVLLDDADVPEFITVIASWVDESDKPRSVELEVPTDGTVIDLGFDLPHGTEVTLTEVALDDSPRFTWATPAWAGDSVTVLDDGSAIVTISAATVAEVSLTNEAIETLGVLELTKQTTGDGAASVPADTVFPVTLTWTDLLGENQELKVDLLAGKTTIVEGLPLGTEVTIVEGETTIPGDVTWKSVEWATADEHAALAEDGDSIVLVVTGEAGTKVELTVTNEFEKKPDLAVTGADMLGWSVFAGIALLLVGGGALLVIRKRRTA